MSTNDTNDAQDGTAMLQSPEREVERSVTTDLDVLRQDAAIAVSINPMTAEIVDAGVTEQGELRIDVRGEKL